MDNVLNFNDFSEEEIFGKEKKDEIETGTFRIKMTKSLSLELSFGYYDDGDYNEDFTERVYFDVGDILWVDILSVHNDNCLASIDYGDGIGLTNIPINCFEYLNAAINILNEGCGKDISGGTSEYKRRSVHDILKQKILLCC